MASIQVLLSVLLACAANDGGGDEGSCEDALCASAGAGSGSGGNPISTGGAPSTGGANPIVSGGAAGAGGSLIASGGSPATGGVPPSAGGTVGSGGSPASGGAPPSAGGTAGSGGSDPVPRYTLVVDAPADLSTVQGIVAVSGRAPGFLNVEVWDATHTNPPLAQATPSVDGTFATTVDVSSLAQGSTTWTIHAWDSPPGQSFTNTDSVTLTLTIGGVASCSGQNCSGHGTCSATGGQASCSCDAGYHAVGLSCVADSTGEGEPDPGMAYVPSGYQLVFSDEFSATSLDTAKWNTLAPYGVQFYSDSHQKQAFIPQAVTLANGIVTFTARPSTGNTNGQPYSSGSITTNGTFTHGYFEARVRVPAGKGLWPAYWLTSSTRWPPEWDIFEIIDGVIFGYTHPVSGGLCSFVEGAAGGDSTYIIPDVYGVYHIYGFTWTSSDIYWYVDGLMTEHYRINAAAGANDPFWLNLSLQVGGDWPGDPDSTTPFPARMDVDYVRIYQQ